MKPSEIDEAIVEALRGGAMGKAVLRGVVGCPAGDLDQAIRRMRYAGKLHWSRLELAPSMLLDVPEEHGDEAPATAREGSDAAASDIPHAVPDSAPGPVAAPAPPPAAISVPPGITRTRSPGDVIRRIALELDLADPRRVVSVMVQHWPEAARRCEQLALARSTNLAAVMMEGLSLGLDRLETGA